jgi:microcystin-dependent protein
MKMKLFLPVLIALFIGFTPKKSSAQESMLAEIRLFAGNFAPRGWVACEGQLIPISQNTALFSLLGTMYGGDGRTTFALPDLRGRVPLGVGNGPGLNPVKQGEKQEPQNITVTIDGKQSITTKTPSLGLKYIICIAGIFPSRN